MLVWKPGSACRSRQKPIPCHLDASTSRISPLVKLREGVKCTSGAKHCVVMLRTICQLEDGINILSLDQSIVSSAMLRNDGRYRIAGHGIVSSEWVNTLFN